MTSMDLGTSGGQWLFKDRDLLMGPVPASTIIDKLGSGEITPESMVANEDEGEWRHLREFEFFRVHVAKAQARSRVMREKKSDEAARRRSRRVKLAVIAVSAVILVAMVAGGAWYYVTSRRIGESSAELAEIGITVSPPVIALASLSTHLSGEAGEDYLDVDLPEGERRPGATSTSGRKPATSGRKPGSTGKKPSGTEKKPEGTAVASAGAAGTQAPGGETGPADSDGLAMGKPQYDMGHIQSVLKKQSSTLFPCIKEEVQRTGFKGSIPFEFVVTNAGKVGKIWIDNRQLRGTPMEKCFQREMAKWRFKPFDGERPTVSQSFTIR
ncbi:MAG: AgmX/PglI C-terminal domain-containing protein [Deltaproteobacteria bacterium]|nr:AgmX/PglI C-terminal domain-containing protein [Deltaproteobacteria bacterium]